MAFGMPNQSFRNIQEFETNRLVYSDFFFQYACPRLVHYVFLRKKVNYKVIYTLKDLSNF